MRSTSRGAGLIVLGLLASLALAMTAQAQGSGVLAGQVVNGTAGGAQVGAGITVTLHHFRGSIELDPLQTTTDAEGRFRFEGLDMDAELEYWPEALYLGVPYSDPEPYRFTAGQTTLPATVTVYETTDDDSAITLDSVHIIAESFGQVQRLSEIHLFGNSGDRTFTGRSDGVGQPTTVRVPLPAGAVGLAFQEGIPAGRFVEVEEGLADTEPVPPGQGTSLIVFSYHLMADGETIPLERRFAYPLHTLSVLVAQPGLSLRSDQLQGRGTELIQGQSYELYSIQGLAAETPLVLELLVTGSEAMPAAPAAPVGVEPAAARAAARGQQGLLRWFGFGLAVLAVAGALLYPVARRRPAAAPEREPSLAANPKARRLLAELADLEAAFEAGQVDEATYQDRRAAKYEALKSL